MNILKKTISVLLLSCVVAISPAQEMPVMVNQMGYNTEGPKRFTAPLIKEGSFVVTLSNSKKHLFKGDIENSIGDFTSFQPVDVTKQYVIRVENSKGEKGVSYPFSIGLNWIENASFKPALNFMIDARS